MKKRSEIDKVPDVQTKLKDLKKLICDRKKESEILDKLKESKLKKGDLDKEIDGTGYRLIHLAVRNLMLELTKALIDLNVDLKSKNSSENLTCLEILLTSEKYFNGNFKYNDDDAEEKRIKILEIFLQKMVLNSEEKLSIYAFATKKGLIAEIEKLLSKKTNEVADKPAKSAQPKPPPKRPEITEKNNSEVRDLDLKRKADLEQRMKNIKAHRKKSLTNPRDLDDKLQVHTSEVENSGSNIPLTKVKGSNLKKSASEKTISATGEVNKSTNVSAQPTKKVQPPTGSNLKKSASEMAPTIEKFKEGTTSHSYGNINQQLKSPDLNPTNRGRMVEKTAEQKRRSKSANYKEPPIRAVPVSPILRSEQGKVSVGPRRRSKSESNAVSNPSSTFTPRK